MSLAVKSSVDENRAPGRFILTGSSDLARAAGAKDSRAGRAVGVRVYPLSLSERQGSLASGTFVDRFLGWAVDSGTVPTDPCSREKLAALIEVSGYPTVQNLTQRQRRTWFNAYVHDVVGLDVIDHNLTRYPGRLTAVLRMMVAQQSQELLKATLARETDIPETTITSYTDILGRIYLVERIRPWSRNLVSREKGKPKALVNDSGLAAHLSGQSAQRWLDSENPSSGFGHAVEGALTPELIAQSGWSDQEYEVFHWCDRSGYEVDVFCELPDGTVLAFEIKVGAPRAKHLDSLKFIRKHLGDRFRAGFVVGHASEVTRWGSDLYSIPWASLWS